MKDEGYSLGLMLVSFFLGGIVGAGLTILLAPQSGAKPGKKISDFSNLKDRTSYYVENTKDKITSYDSGG